MEAAQARYNAAMVKAGDDIDLRYASADAATRKAEYEIAAGLVRKSPGAVPRERLDELLLKCKEADLAVEKTKRNQRAAVEAAEVAKAELEAAHRKMAAVQHASDTKPPAVSGAAEPKALQVLERPKPAADPLQSSRAADMRTIVLAALEYATEHPDWPKTLDELKPKYVDAGKIDLGRFVYHSLSQESSENDPQEVAVLSEKEPASPGGQLVGFADGYVEFVRDPEQVKRLFPAEAEPLPAK